MFSVCECTNLLLYWVLVLVYSFFGTFDTIAIDDSVWFMYYVYLETWLLLFDMFECDCDLTSNYSIWNEAVDFIAPPPPKIVPDLVTQLIIVSIVRLLTIKVTNGMESNSTLAYLWDPEKNMILTIIHSWATVRTSNVSEVIENNWNLLRTPFNALEFVTVWWENSAPSTPTTIHHILSSL